MRIRINVNSLKNAMGTVFLLAAAFFVCSTFISMRSVFADPIAPANSAIQTSGRISPRANATSRANVSRATVARTTTAQSRSGVSRANGSRNVQSRSITPTRSSNTTSRNVTSRNNTRTTVSNRAVRARTSATPSRVSASGSVMAGSRAGSSNQYSYLSSKLYTGSYANIVDSSTGLIAADAYANCMESYYACMDEICTARNDVKGRCSCAGRVNNYIDAEEQLEKANEELIKLSGQLSLLIATKGKGKDLASAFTLTEAEQVMNCVSYKENVQGGKMTDEEWYAEHPTVENNNPKTSGIPSYCSNNNFGFDLKNINGSSSDVLAQLKAWADAKDLAKSVTEDDTNNLQTIYSNISSIVRQNSVSVLDDDESVSVDSLANKWGYKLFEYAHNNVCGRVLDSCFNGIYEACGTPVSITDSDGKTHKKCANGLTTSCPFNYNSYIKVSTEKTKLGDVILNERGSTTATLDSNASCFGYTSTTTTTTGTRTVQNVSADPYYTLRGPVADARRSIIQKYLLDANSACDVYGDALMKTAQNINYQKIAAEQALQQKRLEFKQQADAAALSEATVAIDNFNECVSEIWDCYTNYADEDSNWTTARIKAYCSQVSQVPHCYETMICSPLPTQLTAVIDLQDNSSCNNNDDYTKNTCRNVVTISEILYGTGATANFNSTNSAELRAACLERSLGCGSFDEGACLRGWTKKGTVAVNDTSVSSRGYDIRYYTYDFTTQESTEVTGISPATYTSSSNAQVISPSDTPSIAGKTFIGWCLNDAESQNCGTTSITIPKDTTGTVKIYAVFE